MVQKCLVKKINRDASITSLKHPQETIHPTMWMKTQMKSLRRTVSMKMIPFLIKPIDFFNVYENPNEFNVAHSLATKVTNRMT